MGSELSEIPRILLLIVLPIIVLISITLYTYLEKTLDQRNFEPNEKELKKHKNFI